MALQKKTTFWLTFADRGVELPQFFTFPQKVGVLRFHKKWLASAKELPIGQIEGARHLAVFLDTEISWCILIFSKDDIFQ